MKKYLFIIIFILFTISSIISCSIFKYTYKGKTYFCGNEDWTFTDPDFQTFRSMNKKYGYILFGWERYLPGYPQAGINSEGLCFDWATVPGQGYIYDKSKSNKSINFTVEVLQSCKNINEVIEYVNKYNISNLANEHIIFSDKQGQSCVIEYNEGKIEVIKSTNKAQYITNFNLSNPEQGWYPCERYNRMKAFFNENENKENRLAELLDKTHQEGQTPTIYSYIFNLDKMEITVFFNHNFKAGKTYLIKDLLNKEQKINIYN